MIIVNSEDVKQAISEQLIRIFPDVAIYKEAVSEPVYPHFYIYQINISDFRQRDNYHVITYQFDVRYRNNNDPTTDLKLQKNLDNVALKLFANFNTIQFEQVMIRLKDKSTNKTDGVLHFLFSINLLMNKISNIDEGKLNQKLEVKFL